MKVWVLHITHRHGDDITVYADRGLAEIALADYCREWWESEFGDEAIPQDSGEIITRYFESVPDEWAVIDEQEVKGA